MKRSEIANIMLWVFPLLLIVPNIALGMCQNAPLLYSITNIFLPLGIYYLLFSLSQRVGRTILFFFPVIFYAAFQIVLLYLYGDGIIAVDMLLNVTTTNASEASELLMSLSQALLWIFILYLIPLIWAIIALAKRWQAQKLVTKLVRDVGFVLSSVGVMLLIATSFCYSSHDTYAAYPTPYRPNREIFPVNVACNTLEAVRRSREAANYHLTSADFSYHAQSRRQPEEKEAYVLVIGETSRADNWQILGYNRPTNPRLSKRTDIVACPHAFSQSNTTHKSVPMILSFIDATNFADSISRSKSAIEAFKEAGFHTAFISDQGRNHSYIDYFGSEADEVHFILEEGHKQLDSNLLLYLQDFIRCSSCPKLMVVLHTYGSHFNYRDRYPEDFKVFDNDEFSEVSPDSRQQLLNAYDNTICYTDYVLDSVISELDSLNIPAAMVYLSDHGEDIYDDADERFLHASPTPTYYQVHVPFIVWMSPEYRQEHPYKWQRAMENRNLKIASTKAAFHTLLDLGGINTPYFHAVEAITRAAYTPQPLLYLNDYNEPVTLRCDRPKYGA